MAENLEVVVGGRVLSGWEEVSVSRGVDKFAGSFSIRMAEVEPNEPSSRLLTRGELVSIYVDDDLVLQGHIEKRTKSYDGGTNSISISGRDRVADLVDCSAMHIPGEWTGGETTSIVAQLLEGFPGLRFRADLSEALTNSAKFALQTGESVFSALDRLARMRGLLLLSDLEGGVFFGRPGQTRAPVSLSRGSNIESGSITDDATARFSRYVINGQGPTNDFFGASSSEGHSFQASATDDGVGRPRPMLMLAESTAGEADLEVRVAFEANVRAARSARVSYTLPNWRLDGYLWKPGELVSVFDPILEVGTAAGAPVDLMIGAVEWTRASSGGSRTKLELYTPGAFTPTPVVPPSSEGAEHWVD